MRKKKVIKTRSLKPDKKYGSVVVSRLINKVMRKGEKRKAAKIVYQTAQIIEKNTSTSFLTVLEKAIKNANPGLEMKRRKIGGSNYRVPQPISEERALKTVLRWFVECSKFGEFSTKKMFEKLAEVILGAYNNTGEAFKKRENLRKEAESSRVFSSSSFNR